MSLPKPSPKHVVLFCIIVGIVLVFSAFNLRSHQSIEWGVSVYLTTFQSVQHGFPIYSQTCLSQPPGCFIALFPLYELFGSTIESGRLAVFFYSLIGLAGIIWLGWELNSTAF